MNRTSRIFFLLFTCLAAAPVSANVVPGLEGKKEEKEKPPKWAEMVAYGACVAAIALVYAYRAKFVRALGTITGSEGLKTKADQIEFEQRWNAVAKKGVKLVSDVVVGEMHNEYVMFKDLEQQLCDALQSGNFDQLQNLGNQARERANRRNINVERLNANIEQMMAQNEPLRGMWARLSVEQQNDFERLYGPLRGLNPRA